MRSRLAEQTFITLKNAWVCETPAWNGGNSLSNAGPPPGPDVIAHASAVEQRYQTWFDMNPSLTIVDRVLFSGTGGTE